jgi:lactoylglutathione lyase
MSPLWSIQTAQHVGLHVRDLEKSLHFYRDLLGFEVVMRWNPREPYIGTLVGHPDPNLHAAVLRAPGADVMVELVELRGVPLEPAEAAQAPPGTAHVGFIVANLDQAYEDLTARGVRAISAPVTPTIGPNKGGRAVYLLDPDGIRIELIQKP